MTRPFASLFLLALCLQSGFGLAAEMKFEQSEKRMLVPAIHWDWDTSDPLHLLPQKTFELFFRQDGYSENHLEEHSAGHFIATSPHDTVVLDHIQGVESVNCTGLRRSTSVSISIGFDDLEAFGVAKKKWGNTKGSILFAGTVFQSPSCRPAEPESHRFWALSSKINFQEPYLVTVKADMMELKDVISNIDFDLYPISGRNPIRRRENTEESGEGQTVYEDFEPEYVDTSSFPVGPDGVDWAEDLSWINEQVQAPESAINAAFANVRENGISNDTTPLDDFVNSDGSPYVEPEVTTYTVTSASTGAPYSEPTQTTTVVTSVNEAGETVTETTSSAPMQTLAPENPAEYGDSTFTQIIGADNANFTAFVHDNGNLYLLPGQYSVQGASFMKQPSGPIFADYAARMPHMYLSEMEEFGVSRLRFHTMERMPKTAVLISFHALPQQDNKLIAVTSTGMMYYFVACDVVDKPTRVFLLEDPEPGLAFLQSEAAQSVVTGGEVEKCQLVALVAG